VALLRNKLEEKKLKDSGGRFIRYLAIKICDNTEELLAYSDISGRLYAPNHSPTFFADIRILRKAIKKSKEYLKRTNPTMERKTEFIIFRIEFKMLNSFK